MKQIINNLCKISKLQINICSDFVRITNTLTDGFTATECFCKAGLVSALRYLLIKLLKSSKSIWSSLQVCLNGLNR